MTIEIFQGHNVRIEIKDNTLWYNLPDVCKVLELSNPTKVAQGIKENALTKIQAIDSMGRKQNSNYVNDRGLLRLMNRSYSKNVEEFQDWIDERAEQMLQGKTVNASGVVDNLSKLEILKMAIESEEARLALQAENKELKPKASVHDKVLDKGSSLGFRQIAATLRDDFPDLTESRLKEIMRDEGLIQKKSVDSTAKARTSGFALDVAVGTHGGKTRTQTRWTTAGLQYLILKIEDRAF